jgi:hypothetical protein
MTAATVGDDDNMTVLDLQAAGWSLEDQEQMTTTHLKRLEHVRGLLQAKTEPGAESARMFLFSGTGFSAGLVEQAAKDPTIQLIGLDRLYYGSLQGLVNVEVCRFVVG